MAIILIERGPHKVIIDDQDLPLVSPFCWRLAKGRFTHYATATINGKPVAMHRLILNINSRNVHTDHINGNGLDNRRENIRACTLTENNRNRRAYKNNQSGIKGLTKSKNGKRWSARITKNGKVFCLGTYATPEAAAIAYDQAAKELHGEFANLNFKD